MVKIILLLVSSLVVAGTLMQLRQQGRDLAYENNRLHAHIRDQQARLWNHQLRIAAFTAPPAIMQTVGQHDLELVPAITASGR